MSNQPMSSHTPGPWTFDYHFRDFRGPDDRTLDDHRVRSDREIIANRNLQLAAPTLLAACIRAAESNIYTHLTDEQVREIVANSNQRSIAEMASLLLTLRAAIAEAHGETPKK